MSDGTRQALNLLRAESEFWALSPNHFDGLVARLARQAGARTTEKQPAAPASQNTAVISIQGPLVKRGSFFSEMFGLASYARIQSQLAQAVADRSVDKILLLIDSPGGSVAGCEETAAAVAAAARIKPVVTYVDGLMASAALWIGTQANSITITPSGEAGSVGVIALHLDYSDALKQAGIQPTFIISKISPRKADLNSYQPIGSEAKARAQSDIDKIAAKFVATVARGRSITSAAVLERFGKGDCLLADAAVAAGMVDAIGTMADAINRTSGTPRRSAIVARPSAEHRHRIAELAQEPLSGAAVRRRLAILSA